MLFGPSTMVKRRLSLLPKPPAPSAGVAPVAVTQSLPLLGAVNVDPDPVSTWIQQTWGSGPGTPVPTLGELIGQQQSVEAGNREAVAKAKALEDAKGYLPLVAAVAVGIVLLFVVIRR